MLTDKELDALWYGALGHSSPEGRLVRQGDILQLISEVRRLRGILTDCHSTLELVLTDEDTVKAGLWQGPALPRRLRQIEEALGLQGRGAVGEGQ